ncbi:hypothetical protein Q31b_30050 [Novipirellula aureliae]|uniref:Uncharacterized protein n=1 Tax=Novipirellula aureliae TaxID=2527966 RepID=A0A5C6E2F2_9BACT|nr:hypothetical protein [Novipirellula aureliae]TWU41556.1 hypothetical protein Q31b_30050 [Novipirellula aureliae]
MMEINEQTDPPTTTPGDPSDEKKAETKPTEKKKKEASKSPDQNQKESPTRQAKERPTNSPASKPSTNRPKKTKASAATKQTTVKPSEYQLEHLAAAVAAAKGADNLLAILGHVEEAGGHVEVIESIETYRALKTAVEQS